MMMIWALGRRNKEVIWRPSCPTVQVFVKYLLVIESSGAWKSKMAAWGNAEKKTRFFFGFTPRGLRNANHSGLSTEAT